MSDIQALLREAAEKVEEAGWSILAGDLVQAAEAVPQPVAWVMILPDGGIDWGDDCFSDYPELGRIPLYPHPPKPDIPEGYVLMPIRPNDAMLEVILNTHDVYGFAADLYEALIAAAQEDK